MTIDEFIGHWESITEYDRLDTGSNLSNWIGQAPIPGKVIFIISQSGKKREAKIGVPVAGDGLIGHYYIYEGQLKIEKSTLEIEQGGTVPVTIAYSITKNGRLTLDIFKRSILFEKRQKK